MEIDRSQENIITTGAILNVIGVFDKLVGLITEIENTVKIPEEQSDKLLVLTAKTYHELTRLLPRDTQKELNAEMKNRTGINLEELFGDKR